MSFKEALDRELGARLAEQDEEAQLQLDEDAKNELVRSVVRSLLEIVIDIRDHIINDSSDDDSTVENEKLEEHDELSPRPSLEEGSHRHDSRESRDEVEALEESLRSRETESSMPEQALLGDLEGQIKQEILEMNELERAQREQLEKNEQRISQLLAEEKVDEKQEVKTLNNASTMTGQGLNGEVADSQEKREEMLNESSAGNLNARRQSNLLDDKNDIIELICSISEIETGAREGSEREAEHREELSRFISAKQDDIGGGKPARISTFSETEEHNNTISTGIESDTHKTPSEGSLFLTHQSPLHPTESAVETMQPLTEPTKSLNMEKVVNGESEEDTMNFNYIDQNQFRRLQIKSPSATEPESLEKPEEETNVVVRESKNTRKKVPNLSNIGGYRTEHRAYAERYSQKIYELGGQLKEKNEAIEKLQSEVVSTKSLASSEHHINESLRQELKAEQSGRLSIQKEMLKLKQEYEMKLERERQEHYSLNKQLLKELGYIRNESMRNSQLALSEPVESPREQEQTKTPFVSTPAEVVEPPPAVWPENELSLSAKAFRNQDVEHREAPLIDSLVNQVYAKTISEDIQLKLSEEQEIEVKLNLREQLIEAIQNQGADLDLHFTPVKIQEDNEISDADKREQELSPTKAEKIKIVDPPSPGKPSLPLDSSVNIPLTLVEESVHNMQREIDSTVFIKEPSKIAKPPFVKIDSEVHNSVPPRVRLEPESESSDISRLSKVRSLRIKQYGEIGCLFLLKVDDAQIRGEQDIKLFDAIKELSGSIPSLPLFIEPTESHISTIARLLEQEGSLYMACVLKSVLFLAFFAEFGVIPSQLQLAVARLSQEISTFDTFDARLNRWQLDLVIACVELSSGGVAEERANILHHSIRNALSEMNLMLEDVEFSPFKTPQLVTYLSSIRILRSSNTGTPETYAEFAVAIGQLAARMRVYCDRAGDDLLNYEVVAVACIALVAIEIGACEIDHETQSECLSECERIIRSCKGITKVPGLEELMRQ